MDKPTPLGPAEAYEAIQALLDESDSISRTLHAKEQMLARGFTLDDVRLVLRKGTVAPDPEWDEVYQNWKYRMRGSDCEGDQLTIIVALQPAHARITLITGF